MLKSFGPERKNIPWTAMKLNGSGRNPTCSITALMNSKLGKPNIPITDADPTAPIPKMTFPTLQASHCSMSFEDWWNDHENGCPTLVLDNDEQFARAVWDAAVNAATILIAAKGRHNTILAYEGLHDTLQSTNPKEL